MTLKKTLIRNSFWLFSSDFIEKVISYVLIVIIARYLGDVGLGEYSFIFAFIGTTFLVSDFGFGFYMLREVSKYPKKTQRYFSNVLSIKLILVIIGVSSTLFFTLFIDKPVHVIAGIFLLCIIMTLLSFIGLFEIVFQSRNEMAILAKAKLLERFIAFSLGAYFLIVHRSLLLFVAILVASHFIRFLYEFFYVLKYIKFKPAFEFKLWKKLFLKGLPFWMTGLFVFIYFKIDTVMLSLMVGDQVVGWYNAGYKLVDALNSIPYVLMMAIFPSMSRLYTVNKPLLKILFKRVLRYLIYLALPLGMGTIILADRIIYFIYGSQFQNSIIALQILVFAEIILFANYLHGNLLNAINKEKFFTLITGILAAVNVILNFILIPIYSYIGAGIATVICEILNFLLLNYYSKKFLVKIEYRPLLFKPIIATTVMCLVLFEIKFLAIWWLIPIGVLTYCLMLAILGIEPEDKALLLNTYHLLHEKGISRFIRR